MKREEKNLSAKRRLYEARARGAERFYEWNEPEDLRDRYNDVDVSGVTENIPLIVFEGDKKYLAAYHYEAEGRIDSKAEEIFQLTTFRFFYFGLYEFPKDGVITDSWNKNSAKVASIIDGYKGDIDRLDRITVTDGTPVVEALKAQAIKGAEKNYLNGYGDEWIYGWSDYEDADEAPDNEVGLSIFLNYEGELNGEPGKNIEESARKGENKMKKSSKRRIEEARARGAERFYEWDASKDRAWLRAHDKYLDRLAGDLNKPYDDSLEDKYDKVWVHGHTENVPLVVFEGDKKYLASYEYEVTGKIDANAEEVFQLTDALEFLSFDLYDFPKAGGIPADWNEKDDVIVASISDDKERLAGITVVDGTPVVTALEDQMIKGVEKEYFDGDVEEYYSDDYDPDYDDIELEVDLVYKGELNKKSMNESAKKLRDKNKRLRKDSPDMKSLKEYHGIDPQDDYNEPLDAKFMIDVATSDDPYGTPLILFDGDKKYSAYIHFMARGWVHIDENDSIEIGRHKIHIQDMAIGKYDSDQVKDGTWLDNLSDIDVKVIDDKFLNGLKTEDGRTLKQACEDILAEIIHTNYETGEYNLEYAEEDGENYIDFFFNTYINDDSLEESANKSETKLTESRDSWTVTDTYEVENSLDEPLKAKYNDREYECYYTLECTGEFGGDEDGCNSAWLVDYKILACELEPLDPKGDGDYIMIEDEDLDTEESQEIMKNLVVYDGDKEMSFFDYMDEVAEGSVDDHEIEDLDYDDWYDSGADDEYDKYRDDNL